MKRMSPAVEKASDFCTYCPKMCRFACPVADAEARETSTPWGLMSLLRAVRLEQVPLDAQVGELFYHCTSCRRCTTYCAHDNDVAEAMIAARRLLVDSGVGVPEAVEGVELVYERHGSPFGAPVAWRGEQAEAVFEAGAEVAYWPSCRMRAEAPEALLATGRALKVALGGAVALAEARQQDGSPAHCCGEALREAGYGAVAERDAPGFWGAMGQYRRLVTDCAGTLRAWVREHGTRQGGPEHVVELLARTEATWRPEVAPVAALSGRRVFFHDDGALGRGLQMTEAPRQVLSALLGEPPEELWLRGDEALAAGVGAHYERVAPEAAADASRAVLADALRHGAEILVVVDPSLAAHLEEVREALADEPSDAVLLRHGEVSGAAQKLRVVSLMACVAEALGLTTAESA